MASATTSDISRTIDQLSNDEDPQIRADVRLLRDAKMSVGKKTLITASAISLTITLLIVLLAMKKQPMWLKLVVFFVIMPPLTGISWIAVAGGQLFKLSDEAQAVHDRLRQYADPNGVQPQGYFDQNSTEPSDQPALPPDSSVTAPA